MNLTASVSTMTDAVALSEAIGTADADAPAGVAVNTLFRFLLTWTGSSLVRDAEQVEQLLAHLGPRAERFADWLARKVDDPTAAAFWRTRRDELAVSAAQLTTVA